MAVQFKARLGALDQSIWGVQTDQMPRWRAGSVNAARTLVVLVRDIASGELTMRAMSLVYTTLLSIVPLLALSFSVLKAFGVHQQIEPMLINLLAPLGEQGIEVTRRIIGFIENMNVGVLGSLGLAMLFYTAVSLMEKVEESFNYIWHVKDLRSMGERFSRYLSALLIGPVLVFSALGVTATVMSTSVVQGLLRHEPFGRLLLGIGQSVPFLMVIAAFTFLYMFMPNTRVRFRPALLGGIVGGLLWQTTGWGFAAFVASSSRYEAIYSGFAILILFMIWLYLSWLVLLIGAAIAFYVQHPRYLLVSRGEPRMSNRMRERLALAVMALVGERFRDGQPPPTRLQLAHEIGAPEHMVDAVLESLHDGGFLVRTDDKPAGHVPARDGGASSLADLLRAVRAFGEDRYFNSDRLRVSPRAQVLLDRVEQSIDEALHGLSVTTLTEGGNAPRNAPPRSDEPRPRESWRLEPRWADTEAPAARPGPAVAKE